MIVYEYKTRLRLQENLSYMQMQGEYACFTDSILAKSKKYLDFHNSKEYKGYVYDSAFPIESDGIYKKGKVYTIRLRTVRRDLAEYFSGKLPFYETTKFCGVGGELRIIPQGRIEQIYSITPMIMKNDFGYWRGHMSLPEFEERLKINLIKKYKFFTGQEIDEDFMLYDFIKFLNKKPIKMPYKGINLLGDKICIQVASNSTAQEIAYLAVGTGLGEMNSRGYGFINYKYL